MTDVLPRPSAGAELRYTWDWSPGEHRRMSRSLFRHAAVRYWTYGLLGMGTAGLALSLWSAVRTGVADWVLIVLPLICVASFSYSIFWEVPRRLVRWQLKLHSGPRWLAIDGEGMQGGCDKCSMRIGWGEVRKAAETREFVFLFIAANDAFWLPKRVLADAELDRLRQAIREKLGPRAKLLAA
jgi:hypothetical protein